MNIMLAYHNKYWKCNNIFEIIIYFDIVIKLNIRIVYTELSYIEFNEPKNCQFFFCILPIFPYELFSIPLIFPILLFSNREFLVDS